MFLKHFLFLILIAVCAAHNGRGKGSGRSSNCKKPSGSKKTSSTTVVRTEVQRPVINIDSSLIERPLSLFGSLLDRLVKPTEKKETQNTNMNTNRNPNTRNNLPDYPEYEDVPPQTTNTNRKPTKEEVVERVREHVARDREVIENKKENLENNRVNTKSIPEKQQQNDDPLKKAHWYRPFTENDNYDLYDYNEIDDGFK